ncbi:MAG: hypothetical protein Q6356_010250 [Candidatus Wukongarchaeota archaeon]|nr:hypothetical protein [Candidatus Wukongarchaeota archaeon]
MPWPTSGLVNPRGERIFLDRYTWHIENKRKKKKKLQGATQDDKHH